MRQLVYKYHDELVRYAIDYVKSRRLSEKIVEQVFDEICNNPHKHLIDFNLPESDQLRKITCRLVFGYLQKTSSDVKLKNEIWKSLLQTSIRIEDEKIRAEVLNFAIKSIDNLSLQETLIQRKVNSTP